MVQVRQNVYHISPLPHLYHSLSIKITGIDLYHALKMWYWSHKIYNISHLYRTSTTPPPTKITGIDLYLYYALKSITLIAHPPPLPKILRAPT